MTLLDYISNATELPTKTEARTSNLVLVTRPPDFSNLTLQSDWYCDEYDVSGTLSINGRGVEISSPGHEIDKGLFVEVLRSLICDLDYTIAEALIHGKRELGWDVQEEDFSQEAWNNGTWQG